MTDEIKTVTAQEGAIKTKDEKKADLWKRLNELTMDALDFYASDHLDDGDLDSGTDAVIDWLQEAINDEAEIIYYSRAIEFLQENDPSLTRALEIAQEFGYSLDDLNSEKLATILNYEILTEELGKIRDEIDDLIDERQEIQDEEETDEEK